MVANNSTTLKVTLPSDQEIVLTREFDFPRDLVFEAFTRPEHIAQWWGPRGTTVPSCHMDFRPGGNWRFVSRDADGNEFGFKGEIREVVPPERIVQTFEFEGMPGHISVETLRLEDLGGRTRITVTSRISTVFSFSCSMATPSESAPSTRGEERSALPSSHCGAENGLGENVSDSR